MGNILSLFTINILTFFFLSLSILTSFTFLIVFLFSLHSIFSLFLLFNYSFLSILLFFHLLSNLLFSFYSSVFPSFLLFFILYCFLTSYSPTLFPTPSSSILSLTLIEFFQQLYKLKCKPRNKEKNTELLHDVCPTVWQ